MQSVLAITLIGGVAVTALEQLGQGAEQVLLGNATSASTDSVTIGSSALAGAGSAARRVVQAGVQTYSRIPTTTTPRPITARFLQLRTFVDAIYNPQSGAAADGNRVLGAAKLVFGESTGSKLFAEAVNDFRQSLGENQLLDVVIQRDLDEADGKSRIFLGLAEIVKGETTAGRRLLGEAEQIYQRAYTPESAQFGLIERYRVLADVFDDKIDKVDPSAVEQAFDGRLIAPPLNPDRKPSAGLLRTLKRYDGRSGRYVRAQFESQYSKNFRVQSDAPVLDEKAVEFLSRSFDPYLEQVQQYMKQDRVVINRGTGGSQSRILTPEPLLELQDAVRSGRTEDALSVIARLRDSPDLFTRSVAGLNAELDALEAAVLVVAPRFVPSDQYFPARFRGPRFELRKIPSDLPAPVQRLAEAVNNSIFNKDISPKLGYVQEDVSDALSDVFRAAIRGDVDAIAPMLDEISQVLLKSKNDLDLLEKDLVEYATLFREGRDRLGERRLTFEDDRSLPDALREPADRLANELGDGLSAD